MNQVQIQKISNGFTVTTFSTGAAPAGAVVTFCADLAAVSALLNTYFAS